MLQRRARPLDEGGETRRMTADNAPAKTEQQQRQDGIAAQLDFARFVRL
jgi:hypothetical protein